MKLFNRDSIARDIEFKLFVGKDVWSLIFPNVRDGIRFISGGYTSDKRLYEKMYYHVKTRVRILGGELKSIHIIQENGRRKEIDYRNADKLMGDVMGKHLSVVFKIMVRNKYYEYTVGH